VIKGNLTVKEEMQQVSYASFYANKRHADVNFKLRDGSTLPAHRIVLEVGAEFFEGLFRHHPTGEIEIQEDPEVFRILVEFCYSGEVSVPKYNEHTVPYYTYLSSLGDLILEAHFLQLYRLKEFTKQVLSTARQSGYPLFFYQDNPYLTELIEEASHSESRRKDIFKLIEDTELQFLSVGSMQRALHWSSYAIALPTLQQVLYQESIRKYEKWRKLTGMKVELDLTIYKFDAAWDDHEAYYRRVNPLATKAGRFPPEALINTICGYNHGLLIPNCPEETITVGHFLPRAYLFSK